jgi:hypothetical protein
MTADKKKLLILGILAVVILSVGAFSLSGGSKPAAAPAAPHKHHSFSASASPDATPGSPSATSPNGLATAAAGEKPFGSASSSAVPGSPATAANGSKPAIAPVAEQDFPERDPFDGRKFIPDDKKQTPAAAPAPVAAPAAKIASRPIPPMPVGFDKSGLPSADGGKVALPALNAAPKNDFAYSVVGVITGERPAAVFVDPSGVQRLVNLGGSLDGETKVVAITRGTVTVAIHGKKRTLSVGADTPTEKR